MGSQIAFFDAKPYDRDIFTEVNKDFNLEIRYYKFNLTAENAILAEGAEVVCAFVNDMISSEVIDKLHECEVKLIALKMFRV
jgi:D-lactate dehydrogenase